MIKTNTTQNSLTLWLKTQGVKSDLSQIIVQLADASITIAGAIQTAALGGRVPASGSINIQGEEQKPLDIISNDIVVKALDELPQIAALVSEEIDELIVNKQANTNAPFIVCFDPLDGSSNIETNSAIGTIFSILERTDTHDTTSEKTVLESAQNQVAAGYVLYGPVTILVITTGKTVASFILDLDTCEFVLEEKNLTVQPSAAEFAINMAYQRFWDTAISTYVENCTAGETGPYDKDYGMRWTGAMVADVHRLFIRGGIFIYPALAKKGAENGKLRFLYEANPMALLVEVAGGKAHMRDSRIAQNIPDELHQRVPVVMGSSEEVDRLAELYSVKALPQQAN